MAKKQQPAPSARSAITPERFRRLHQLLHLLARQSKTRAEMTQMLKVDVRGLYRDLNVLREAGIVVAVEKGNYSLVGSADAALALLPFPNPLLTLGEVRQLAKGRGAAQRRLAEQLEQLLP